MQFGDKAEVWARLRGDNLRYSKRRAEMTKLKSANPDLPLGELMIAVVQAGAQFIDLDFPPEQVKPSGKIGVDISVSDRLG